MSLTFSPVAVKATPPTARVSVSTGTAGSPGPGRDRVVDLVRAACLIAVVGLHALMVGVSVQQGSPILENALESWGGFTVFSWFTQMMPLFFILGGFASVTHYRRLRGRGIRPADYIATRLRRLLPVPIAAGVATVIALVCLPLLGASGDMVATAGWRISQPLWFLGVYILCTALVPAMVGLHERAPRATLVGLACAIAAVDGLRFVTGIDAIGFANLLFVWLGVQQLGFWLADGRVPTRRHAYFAIAAMAALMALGLSSANLFEALNPPTAALALLGVVQLAVFAGLRPRLARIAAHPRVRAVSDAINTHAMTIYSWHMPVVVLLGGLLIPLSTARPGFALPIPLSAEWWATRPLWLGAAAALVAVVVACAGRLERGSRGSGAATPGAAAPGSATPGSAALGAAVLGSAVPSSAVRVSLGVLASAGGVLLILAATGSLWAWAAGVALMALGLRLSRRPSPSPQLHQSPQITSVFAKY